jgi:glycosyltransferase involved in cell wall biosynthesis
MSASRTEGVAPEKPAPSVKADVVIVHDYVTQRGGAERVVLSMLRAFPSAPLYTSLFDPSGSFPEFGAVDVRTLALNRAPALRRRHRLALPLLAPAFSRLRIEADIVLCSSSGWAHGADARGRKIVYCHAPARWLYQPQRYLRTQGFVSRAALLVLAPPLRRWDRRAAATADRYLANSTAVQRRIRELYGIEADVLSPPHAIDRDANQDAVQGLEPGFLLCVSRLLPYKNVDAVVRAFAALPSERLVVVGVGPDESRLRREAGPNVRFTGAVSDPQLRWLYANCAGVIASSHEDYGLTPLEGIAFGKPAAVLRWGGFLDTVVEEVTGVFFDRPDPVLIREAVAALRRQTWDVDAFERQAQRFSEERFVAGLREIVAEMA